MIEAILSGATILIYKTGTTGISAIPLTLAECRATVTFQLQGTYII